MNTEFTEDAAGAEKRDRGGQLGRRLSVLICPKRPRSAFICPISDFRFIGALSASLGSPTLDGGRLLRGRSGRADAWPIVPRDSQRGAGRRGSRTRPSA